MKFQNGLQYFFIEVWQLEFMRQVNNVILISFNTENMYIGCQVIRWVLFFVIFQQNKM